MNRNPWDAPTNSQPNQTPWNSTPTNNSPGKNPWQPMPRVLKGSPVARQSDEQRRELRRLSRAGGLALLVVCTLELALALLQALLPGGQRFELFSFLLPGVLCIMPGTLVGLQLLTPAEHNLSLPFRRQKTVRRSAEALVVVAGAFLCLLANLASVFVSSLARRVGFDFTGPSQPAPKTPGSFLLLLLSVAIVPAVTEELLMRGMVLQPLRRFGGRFAVVSSALLFALLHQNMVQAPMAFFSGLVLGWAALKTGRLWAPIIIHFWNNAFSLVLDALKELFGAALSTQITMLYFLSLLLVGVCSLFALKFQINPNLAAAQPKVPAKGAGRQYLLGSPAMVVALVYFVVWIFLGIRVARQP
jgi:membrane protease YdiL (CAAX protease family)